MSCVCAFSEPEKQMSTDVVVQLADLQDFEGYWSMNDKLAIALSLKLGDLTPPKHSGGKF